MKISTLKDLAKELKANPSKLEASNTLDIIAENDDLSDMIYDDQIDSKFEAVDEAQDLAMNEDKEDAKEDNRIAKEVEDSPYNWFYNNDLTAIDSKTALAEVKNAINTINLWKFIDQRE